MLEIRARIKDQELQLKELGDKAKEHKQKVEQYSEFLKLKNKDQKYFGQVVEETRTEIERCAKDVEIQKGEQAKREAVLRGRLRGFSVCAAGLSGGGSARPQGWTAVLALRARCRQLATQGQAGREALAGVETELKRLYDTRERYEAFIKFAQTGASAAEAEVKQGQKRLETIDERTRKGHETIKTLEKEREQLTTLIDNLKRKYQEEAAEAEALKTMEAPPLEKAPTAAAQTPVGAAKAATTMAKASPTAGAGEKVAMTPTEKLPVGPAVPSAPAAPATTAKPPEAATARVLTAPPNTPVLAVDSGHVWFAGPFEGWGNMVVIHHKGDVVSIYSFLGEVAVRPNINVFRGQEIGWVGPLQGSSKYGVRFEVRLGSDERQAVDLDKWAPAKGDLTSILLGAVPQ